MPRSQLRPDRGYRPSLLRASFRPCWRATCDDRWTRAEGAMTAQTEKNAALLPQAPIRRFDVFAEVNRLNALAEGRPEDEAKGYGIWLAKVVAGRRFGRKGDGGERPP